jgi:ketosteroid isomerase-like protein
MTADDSKSVATSFFKAWTTGDFDTARSLLHDDVSFSGPLDSFHDADSYIGALRGLSQIVQAAQEQKVFADETDVCVIYDLVTATPAGTAPTAEWYRLRDGKISSVRVFFDARPFAPMFEHRGG